MALTIEEIKQKIQVIKDRLSKYNFQLGEPVTQAIVEGWEIITANVEKVGYLAVKKQGDESIKAIGDHELVIKDRLDEHVSTISIPAIVDQENKSKKVLSDWASEITTSDDGVVTAEREARISADNTLNSKIEQEITDRTSAVTTLQNDLDSAKTSVNTALDTKFDKAGGTVTGKIYLGDTTKAIDNSSSEIIITKDKYTGVCIVNNAVAVFAYDGTKQRLLRIKGDGALTWDNNTVLTTVNGLPLAGGTMEGNISWQGSGTSIFQIMQSEDKTNIDVGWNYTNKNGAIIGLRSSDHETEAGVFQIFARDTNNSTALVGYPNGTLSWGGATILRSNTLCTTKATTTNPASSSKPCVIVSAYNSGTQWYRKWSDGWIEQGGYYTISHSDTASVKNLITAFTTTNYTIVPNTYGNSYFCDNLNVTAKTTTTFSIAASTTSAGSHAPSGFYFYACGY